MFCCPDLSVGYEVLTSPKFHYQNIVFSTLNFAPNGSGQPLAQIQIQIQVQMQVQMQIQLQMFYNPPPLNFITRKSCFHIEI